MALFQVIPDPQVFHSPDKDIVNRINFSFPQLSRNAGFDTFNSNKQVSMSSWKEAIHYSQQRSLLSTDSFWLLDIPLGQSSLKTIFWYFNPCTRE